MNLDTHNVTEKDAGQRIDKFLHQHYTTTSRSQWQKCIKAGAVLVNNKKATPHYALKRNDTITIADIPHVQTKEPAPSIHIIEENDDYLVIEKPAGVLAHHTPGAKPGPCLTDWLVEYIPDIVHVGDNRARPGIVHRLDREASGVMVISKNNQMFEYLKHQFKNHTIKKVYTALVHGIVAPDTGTLDFPIGRSERGRMAARPRNENDHTDAASGKHATTTFEVVKRFGNCTLVQVQPITGRTHQIRVHFFALGHPLVGDTLYTIKKQAHTRREASRLMLHACELCFEDRLGLTRCFASDLPAEFKTFLTTLS